LRDDRESEDAGVSDEEPAATAAETASVSQSVNYSETSVKPEEMPSFDEWKQKEQEKTKISEGCLYSSLFTAILCFIA